VRKLRAREGVEEKKGRVTELNVVEVDALLSAPRRIVEPADKENMMIKKKRGREHQEKEKVTRNGSGK